MSRGPVLTLAAVVVLGLVLLGVNILAQPSAPNSAQAEPGGPPPTVSAGVQFAGYASTAQGQVPVAVTVDGGKARMYVCDGSKVDAWLQGSAPTGADPRGQLDVNGRNGSRATGTFSGGTVAGSVHLDGQVDSPFRASVTRDGRAGIYRAVRDGKVSGWVVLGNDSDETSASDNVNGSDNSNSDSNSNSNNKSNDDDKNSSNDKNKNSDDDKNSNSDKSNNNDNDKNNDKNNGNGNDDDGKKGRGGKNKERKQTGLTRDSTGAVSPAAPLPLDGPLPSGVSKVDANTDVLAAW